jgi:hypothetical protein
MEQEQLNDRLLGAERVPVHSPSAAGRVSNSREGAFPRFVLPRARPLCVDH